MSSDSIRTFHRRPRFGAAIDVAAAALDRLWLRLAVRNRRRHCIPQLRSLSDATLRDIGLSRSSINATARGPILPQRINHHI
jgi:uncharacterized protein YjiS (DUF1127 family)